MAIKKRGAYWALDISVAGRPRVRESTGIRIDRPDSRKLAQEYHDKIKAELYDKVEAGKTLGDAIKLWLKLKERSEKEQNMIKVFLKLYPNRPLSQVSGLDIHDALMVKSGSYANRIANIIRACLNMAAARKWCGEIKIPKRDTTDPPFRFLTKQQWERLEKELAPHVLVMVKFALDTGLRLANVTKLQWTNINLEKKIAWVEARDAKGKKVISVPLSQRAIAVLKEQIGKHGSYVFVYNNRPITSAKTSFKKSLVRADIYVVTKVRLKGKNKGKEYKASEFRWHDLRHTWASWHVLNKTPLKVLKELGGWASMEMVERYAHLDPEHVRGYADNSGV
jgi:integrase